MKLSDLVLADRVVVPLRSDSLPGAARELLGRLTACGVISPPEALAALPVFREVEVRDQLAVRDLMTPRPRTVSPDTPLRDAALDMVRAGVAGLPVVDEVGRVIGMLSQRELLAHMLTSYLQR